MEITDTNENIGSYEQEIRDITDNFHSELWDLSGDVLKPKVPINDFIEQEKNAGKEDKEIAISLIKAWYWKEIKDSDLSEKIKETLNSFLDKAYSTYWYKAKNRSSFEELLFQIAQRIINKSDTNLNMEELCTKIYWELKNLEMKEPISMDFIKSYVGGKGKITFPIPYWEKLHWDWSNSTDVLNLLSFYNNSFGDDCKFPEWYNPHELFEKWKSIGLGIEVVHESWYTWEWIEVAIIDNPLAKHNDIIVWDHIKSWKNPHFHWSAVASILVGKQNWIAPDASLHYVETSSQTDDKDIYENLSKLKNKKIRVISMSFNLYQEWMDESTRDKVAWLVDEFEEAWTWILSGDEFIRNFWILGKKNPMWDSDDFQNYQVTWPDKRTIDRRKELLNPSYKPKDEKDKQECEFTREFYDNKEIDIEDLIFINSGDRTVADPNWPDSYRYCATIWGTSRTIPAVAWYYALSCQADPENMNPGRFMQLARETAQLIDISDIPEDMTNMTKWRVKTDAKIKVLDINALIQKIEEEKNK